MIGQQPMMGQQQQLMMGQQPIMNQQQQLLMGHQQQSMTGQQQSIIMGQQLPVAPPGPFFHDYNAAIHAQQVVQHNDDDDYDKDLDNSMYKDTNLMLRGLHFARVRRNDERPL
jgi:hypothetical protein